MMTLKLPSKTGKKHTKRVKNKRFDSFLTESVISVNVDGYHIRNSYASKFQYIRIILIKLIRYISSIAPKGLISPQF